MEAVVAEKKETSEKIIKKRLQAIQLADSLGNVSEACRKVGIDRTSFYEWKRRYEAQGIEGLRDLQPSHKDHPHKTPAKVVKKIIDISYQNPDWGCIRVAEQLKKLGMKVSSPTVQKILIKNNLSSVADRASALESKIISEKIKLSAAQIATLEKNNPAFKEKGKDYKAGEMVVVDIFPISVTKAKVLGFLFVGIDSMGMLATSEFYADKEPETVERFIQEALLPFYNRNKIKIKGLFTDKSKEFLSTEVTDYLKAQGITHSIDKKFRVNLNGYMQRFKSLLESELPTLVKKSQGAAILKKALPAWVEQYNLRPIENFPNYGESPMDVWKKNGIKIKL